MKNSSTASGALPSPLKRPQVPRATLQVATAAKTMVVARMHDVCNSGAICVRCERVVRKLSHRHAILRRTVCGSLRGVTAELNNALYLVILYVSGVSKDDQLAEQSECKQL